jgi:hypothetical protein
LNSLLIDEQDTESEPDVPRKVMFTVPTESPFAPADPGEAGLFEAVAFFEPLPAEPPESPPLELPPPGVAEPLVLPWHPAAPSSGTTISAATTATLVRTVTMPAPLV